MADPFREVDEDIRQEKQNELFRKYGPVVLAAALAVVLGMGLRVVLNDMAERRRSANAEAYASASEMLAQDPSAAAAAFQEIAGSGAKGYKAASRLRAAAALAEQGETDAAISAYAAAANDNASPLMQDIARLRAATLLLDHGTPDEALVRLGNLPNSDSPFSALAQEVAGLAHYKANDLVAAEAAFEAILTDFSAPQGLRGRAEFLIGLVRSRSADTDTAQSLGAGEAEPAPAPMQEAEQPAPASEESEPSEVSAEAPSGEASGEEEPESD